MRNYLLPVIGIAALLSCNNEKPATVNPQEHLVYATIWFQRSPEMKALFYQGFNIACQRVEQYARQKSVKPKAVVVDIDETMLDNSPFEAQQIFEGKGFSREFWREWSSKARAEALPGAVAFSRFCDSLKVDVFYISNRNLDEIEPTLRNLDSLGFAFARTDHLLLKETESSKRARREKVLEKYEIVLLVGDNLSDFSEMFENRGNDWGVSMAERYRKEFGNRFIILPNPMYGDWEKKIYSGKDLTEEQKKELRLKALRGFR
jgi:5'-nucleotidase (lipoprotein e(P4) family)